MSLAGVQVKSASRYPLGELHRVLRRHVSVVFSVVERHVRHDFVGTERPRSPQAQDVVDPAYRALTHGLLEHLDSDRPNLWSLEYPPIDLRNLGHESRVPLVGVLAKHPGLLTELRGQHLRRLILVEPDIGTAHEGDPPDALGRQHAKGDNVRGTPRDTERPEALETEVVGHPHEVSGTVEQARLWPGVGVTITGPIYAYEAHAPPANPLRVVEGRVAVQSRSRRSVADANGRSRGIAPGGVPYGPTVVEVEQMIVAGNTDHLCSTSSSHHAFCPSGLTRST